MATTPTDVANAAAERFRAQRERATAKHAKARSDAATLRARVQRESQEMMDEAKRRKKGDAPDERLISPWPEHEAARYQFDDSADDAVDAPAAHEAAPTPRPAPAAQPARPDRGRHARDDDDDDMSEVDTWMR